jgi:hypothetical protein
LLAAMTIIRITTIAPPIISQSFFLFFIALLIAWSKVTLSLSIHYGIKTITFAP